MNVVGETRPPKIVEKPMAKKPAKLLTGCKAPYSKKNENKEAISYCSFSKQGMPDCGWAWIRVTVSARTALAVHVLLMSSACCPSDC